MKRESIVCCREENCNAGNRIILKTQDIRRHYKFLKREMEPNVLVDYLVQHNILNTDENSFLIGIPRAKKCDFILQRLLQHPNHLTELSRMIIFYPQEEGFHCFLSLPSIETSTNENVKTTDKVLNCKCLDMILNENRDELLGEVMHRISSESDSIVDDFLEENLLSIEDHQEISAEKKKSKAAILLLNLIAKRLPGSYLKLLSILKKHKINNLAERLLKEIDRTGLEKTENEEELKVEFVGGDVHFSMIAPQMEIQKIKMIISGVDGNERVLEKVIKEIPNSEELFAQGTHFTFDKTSLGSIIIVLQTESPYAIAKLKQFIEKEGICRFLAHLFESRDVRTLLTKEKYNIEVQIREAHERTDPPSDILKSADGPIPEITHRSLLERCYSFLLEELEPQCLLKEQEVADIFGSVIEMFYQPGLRTMKAEAFLKYLKDQSDEKIGVVLEKLKEKNKHIYDQLVPDTSKYRDIDIEQVKGNILDNLPELLDIVSIRSIQTPFLSTGMISSDELELIHRSNECCRKETLQFVKLILHKGAEAIKLFLSALDASCGKSTVQNLLQPRDVQTTSSYKERHTKIGYTAFNEETGLLFEGKFVIELKGNAKSDENEKEVFTDSKRPTWEELTTCYFYKGVVLNTEEKKQKLLEELKERIGKKTGAPLTVAVIGTPGSGKSSFINTMITSITGNYRKWRRTADFGGLPVTQSGNRISREKYLYSADKSLREYDFPDFVEIAGFQNTNDEMTYELLDLLFYGRIPSNVHLANVAGEIRRHGKWFTDKMYPETPECKKFDRVIFVASAADRNLPVQLMQAVSRVLYKKRDIPVFGVFTKKDLEVQERESEDFEKLFRTTLGLSQLDYLHCTNYCDDNIKEIRERNMTHYPELDIPVLKFLIQVLDPIAECTDLQRNIGISKKSLEWKEICNTLDSFLMIILTTLIAIILALILYF